MTTMTHEPCKRHKWAVENLRVGDGVTALVVCMRCKTIKCPIDSVVTYAVEFSKADDSRRGLLRR